MKEIFEENNNCDCNRDGSKTAIAVFFFLCVSWGAEHDFQVCPLVFKKNIS